MVDRGFTEYKAGNRINLPATFYQQFPVPAYVRDDFAWGIGRMIPLCMTLSWIYFVMTIVKSIVHEKETRVKEYMKIMGLNSMSHWIGWLVSEGVLMLCSVILLTILMVKGKIIVHADPSLVFMLLFLFGVSVIFLSFFISTLFSKARLASVCGGLIYFGCYLPYIFVDLNEQYMLRWQKFMACGLTTGALGIASGYIAKREEMGVGATWANVGEGQVDVCVWDTHPCTPA